MRRPARRKGWVFLGVVLLVAVALGGILLATLLPFQRGVSERIVEVRKGAGLLEISQFLQEERIIWRWEIFSLMALFRGASRSLQAGEYRLSASLSPSQILGILRRGDVVLHSFTVPEGFTLAEVARAAEQAGLASYQEITALSQDTDLLAELDLKAQSLEGYLFPETYSFAKGISARTLIREMVETFRARFTEEMQAQGRTLGLSPHEALTLASIIERETYLDEERPLISAVYHNRLQQGVRLQGDPTVLYALGRTAGPLTKEDLRVNSPYNTYRHHGLPPGPIASPGLASLKAAVNPAPVDYLYFVARGDGGHEFSKTLEEHVKAVRRYRQSR